MAPPAAEAEEEVVEVEGGDTGKVVALLIDGGVMGNNVSKEGNCKLLVDLVCADVVDCVCG